MTEKITTNPVLKLLLDLGPLVLFFAVNARWGIFIATAVFMTAVIGALAVSYVLVKCLPAMTLISAAIVMVFGGLTLLLHDEMFIKIKPTIIYLLFAALLLGGLAVRRPLLAFVLGSVFHLTAEGWRRLTFRWVLFFIALAALNEVVWRTQSTDVWVTFKAFGVVPLTFAFAASQYPLLAKHAPAETASSAKK
jgi:intracellular septation protein